MRKKILTKFKEAIADSNDHLKNLAADGQKSLGYFCTYTPVELIYAAGFIPVRITGGFGTVDNAYLHVPDFICPYMKRGLEKGLAGQYDFLSGLVQGYTCDAACGMVNIWKDIVDIDFFHAMPIPYNNTSESVNFFKSVLNKFIKKIETIGGSYSESALNDSLNLFNRIRTLQLDLYKQRYLKNSPFSAGEFMTIIDAGSVIPPEEYLQLLEKLAATTTENQPVERRLIKKKGCPVLISGSLVERPEVMDIIESCGGQIVADDLCNGLRQILPVDGRRDTPLDRLIHRYTNRFPCPSRSRAINRVDWLADLMKRSNARGAIFVVQKFCTPHLSDYPILSEKLKEKGFPTILIEMDESWQMEGQLRTRLEGFFEMIGN